MDVQQNHFPERVEEVPVETATTCANDSDGTETRRHYPEKKEDVNLMRACTPISAETSSQLEDASVLMERGKEETSPSDDGPRKMTS